MTLLRLFLCFFILFFTKLSFSETSKTELLDLFVQILPETPSQKVVFVFSENTDSLTQEQLDWLSLIGFSQGLQQNHLYLSHKSESPHFQIEKLNRFFSPLMVVDKITFLSSLPEKIDFLFLEAEKFEDYSCIEKELLQLEELEAIYPYLNDSCIVLLENARNDPNEVINQKIFPTYDFLIDQGWKLLYQDKEVLLFRRS